MAFGMGPIGYEGQWWLPGKPENRVFGKLSFEWGKSPTLSLDGVLGNKYETNFFDVILGDSLGVEITLVSCFQTNTTIVRRNEREYVKSEYHVSFFCTGSHFSKREDILFRKISAKYSHLREWLGDAIFDFAHVKENDEEYVVQIKKPRGKEVVMDGFRLKFEGWIEGTHSFFHDSYKKNASVGIEAASGMHIEGLFSILFHVKNFLSLATGENIEILTIWGEKPDAKPHERIEIFSSQTRGERDSKDKFSFYPVPIPYREISEHIDLYAKNWFTMILRIEPAYELFFGNLYGNTYPISRFLGLVQAIEAYHCRTFENAIIDAVTFAELKTCVLKVVDEAQIEHSNEFKNRVEYWNTRSLRNRLRELFGKYAYLALEKDYELFIGKVVDTRNYHTHYDPETRGNAANLKEVFFLIDTLRLLLTAIFVEEIGFKEEQIKRIIDIYATGRTKAIYR